MTFLEKVCQVFEKHKVPYALVGGYAVALHGAPRGTMDIDFIVKMNEEIYERVEAALKIIGLQPRLPVKAKEVFQFRREYIEKRNMVAWSFVNPLQPFEIVDIIITENLDDFSSVEKQLATTKVKVISKRDLIKMKEKAGREQDKIDAEALRRTQ